ncbi:hypothetical protein CQ10_28675 [Bradyrhizobium valentinum]|nr:hypothetical protein CQ10_28675 [Bradyrhizobium valentinum]
MTAYRCRAIQRERRKRITLHSTLHRRATLPAGSPFLQELPSFDAAGALQEQDLRGVHVVGSAALYAAGESEGVRRVILFSAIGTNREAPSDFSRTKQEGEAALMSRDLDWVVLRPSVLVGSAAYGGSALLRGLASLPVLPVMRATAPIQPVHLDDVVETVVFLLEPGAPSRLTLDLAGGRGRWRSATPSPCFADCVLFLHDSSTPDTPRGSASRPSRASATSKAAASVKQDDRTQ